MPYRSPGLPRSFASINQGVNTGGKPQLRQYQNPVDGQTWRHQLAQGATYPGAGVLIPVQSYAHLDLARFERSFGGAIKDNPPTPVTGTNNYQSTRVYNGSRIGNMNVKVTMKNESGGTTPVYVDVYMLALSFEDALIWDALYTTACPVSYDGTFSGINAGRVAFKAIALGLVDRQTINDSNFVKRFIRHMGTVVVPPENDGGVAELILNDIPPKCKRANPGMFYGLCFANDGLKNNGDKSVRIVADIGFDEYPTSNRNVEFPG